jgi:carbon-monoxide dehydrogenase large subunit/6-hydroxypseudooxynicotine dehydrogenase subunit gamma
VTFADYLLPTLRDAPDVDLLLTQDFPSPFNPLGVKSVGEAGIIAVGAAVASAVDEAIGLPGAIEKLPITPQRLRELLQAKAAQRETEKTLMDASA